MFLFWHQWNGGLFCLQTKELITFFFKHRNGWRFCLQTKEWMTFLFANKWMIFFLQTKEWMIFLFAKKGMDDDFFCKQKNGWCFCLQTKEWMTLKKKKKKKKDEDAFSFSANTGNKWYFFCFFANKEKGDKLRSEQKYMYKYLRFPFVWSFVGPVADDPVGPCALDQSNTSSLRLVHVHILVSKSQS